MNVQWVDDITSPVKPMLADLAFCIDRFVPERRDELASMTRDVQIAVSEQPKWLLEAGFGTIQISTGVLEVVWALIAGYWATYSGLEGTDASSGTGDIEITEERVAARTLFLWARRRLSWDSAASAAEPWPDVRIAPGGTSTLERIATELTLGSMAVYLLHELHHLSTSDGRGDDKVSGHRAHEDRVGKEADCDDFATTMVFERHPMDAAIREKRTLCLSVALVIIVGHGIVRGFHDGIEHPRTYDRLIRQLDRWLIEGDASWAVVMTMLALHFRAEERSDDIGRACTTFRDAVLLYRNILRHDDEVRTSG